MSSNSKRAQQEEHHIRTLGLECLTSMVQSLVVSAGLYQDPATQSRTLESVVDVAAIHSSSSNSNNAINRQLRNGTGSDGVDLSGEVNVDPFAASKIEECVQLKQHSIEIEDFETAKLAKTMEQQLKACGVSNKT